MNTLQEQQKKVKSAAFMCYCVCHNVFAAIETCEHCHPEEQFEAPCKENKENLNKDPHDGKVSPLEEKIYLDKQKHKLIVNSIEYPLTFNNGLVWREWQISGDDQILNKLSKIVLDI